MIIYSKEYKQGATKRICLHHVGGIAENPFVSTRFFTADTINFAHRARWNCKSSLGWYGGYNFYIDYQGNIIQFRAIGEETMAAKGFNFNGETIHICLAGNFTKGVDTPTREQENALRELCKQLPQITPYNIVGHRTLTGLTECPGNALKDDWARNVICDRNEQLSIMIQILANLMDMLRKLQNKKLGSVELNDENFIIKEELNKMDTAKIKGILLLAINIVINGGILAFIPTEYKAIALLIFNVIQVIYAYLDPTYTIQKLGMSKSEYLGKIQ